MAFYWHDFTLLGLERLLNELTLSLLENAGEFSYIFSCPLHFIKSHVVSKIEQEYQTRMQSLSVVERVERAQAMFNWTREMLGRQIQAEKGPMSVERLRWEVALRMYGAELNVRAMIERQLTNVPD